MQEEDEFLNEKIKITNPDGLSIGIIFYFF
jgi:hypothetical protein